MHSIEPAGFARGPIDWFISNQDVYAAGFRDKWAEQSKDNRNADLRKPSIKIYRLDDLSSKKSLSNNKQIKRCQIKL
ncbi:unnamed protein product [Phytophthora fragariaefolia]|uniref:Unnamed protein product n=1 Tax=Phytophthora fragariaefolia TaxID=1490495 RepID=A0A9W6YD28_9STRA|nr:unnamed protein product [Phytophthora fragariaefolia]